jgi:hypothetical protein
LGAAPFEPFFPLVHANGQGGELPLRWGFMKKAAGEPGLEVAERIRQRHARLVFRQFRYPFKSR